MKSYASDLSDAEWANASAVDSPSQAGRPSQKHEDAADSQWHMLVDTMGLLIKVVVHVANLQDREEVKLLLEPIKGRFPLTGLVWVDNAYTGTGRTWIKEHMSWEVEVVSHPRRPSGMGVYPGEEIDYRLFERPKGFRH